MALKKFWVKNEKNLKGWIKCVTYNFDKEKKRYQHKIYRKYNGRGNVKQSKWFPFN